MICSLAEHLTPFRVGDAVTEVAGVVIRRVFGGERFAAFASHFVLSFSLLI
ncbi:hypothetical protein QEH42_gp143 [Microbacterium phage Pumpernickel]|uniref:Uncharacterized protein n=1 Tax=Microbacterium phage Pumpernickel TaxID=2885983 RepID=A0AAE8Y6Z2_9CAUD|nr:hypothetical protein QEH42_gp024 [Microbacterium phage Pumpernickel]YP_010755315.1 hypothetical protein QEH42_gp143 [Microbacterium phage Pumpernickel]UDL15815.1 hypothetical protein SEA_PUMPERNICKEL_24 [Microbacterium phage Pumpernickel]UDL16075.1 hypothetical protein SEA_PUMPERNICKEL_325 [Microbacterium phage Pumpernickel]